MRRVILMISALLAAPALAQHSNYGYDVQYQQQYFAQRAQGGHQNPLEPVAHAQINPAAGLVNTDYLNVGIGATQVVDTNQNVLFNLEYRYQDIYYGLRPIIGFHIDNEEALYGYAGFNWDVRLSDSWWFTPTASVGAYSQGDGQDLGHWIEFRTGVELAYRLKNQSRIGLQLTHLSNAGLGDSNPGTEIVQLNYAHPLGWLD